MVTTLHKDLTGSLVSVELTDVERIQLASLIRKATPLLVRQMNEHWRGVERGDLAAAEEWCRVIMLINSARSNRAVPLYATIAKGAQPQLLGGRSKTLKLWRMQAAGWGTFALSTTALEHFWPRWPDEQLALATGSARLIVAATARPGRRAKVAPQARAAQADEIRAAATTSPRRFGSASAVAQLALREGVDKSTIRRALQRAGRASGAEAVPFDLRRFLSE